MEYEMFDGKITDNVDKYLKSWEKASKKLKNLFGKDVEICGFGPDISLGIQAKLTDVKGEQYTRMGSVFTLPIYMARRLLENAVPK